MEKARRVKRVVEGVETRDGAGVRLVRVIGKRDVLDFDPFLMLDAFDNDDPRDYVKGFPWHPHRGIETVTYLIEGNVEHGDSLGNAGVIGDGDCQWMTAGRGIVHQEMPKESSRMLGTQLWVNLPAKDKMTAPKYRDIKAADIPVIEEKGYTVRLIAGTYGGIKGPMEEIAVQPTYMDVEIEPTGEFSLDVSSDDTLFVYIVRGTAVLPADDNMSFPAKRAVLFGQGSRFEVKAGTDGLRLLLFSGKPLREPIAWGGPIVMNTKEELEQAFKEIDEGTFIR
jgi:redox-sensitive bicupin YhaK (pirin superfamily)